MKRIYVLAILALAAAPVPAVAAGGGQQSPEQNPMGVLANVPGRFLGMGPDAAAVVSMRLTRMWLNGPFNAVDPENVEMVAEKMLANTMAFGRALSGMGKMAPMLMNPAAGNNLLVEAARMVDDIMKPYEQKVHANHLRLRNGLPPSAVQKPRVKPARVDAARNSALGGAARQIVRVPVPRARPRVPLRELRR